MKVIFQLVNLTQVNDIMQMPAYEICCAEKVITQMIKKSLSWFIILSLLFVTTVFVVPTARAASDIKLLVDGKDITSLSSPMIVNDRTLVPVRFVAEELGADVQWDGEAYTVTITKGSRVIFLTIGSQLVEYDNGTSCIVSDVAPMIINDRTYVPIRLISNAFGIGISWDDATRTVSVDSGKESKVEAFYDVDITSISHGDRLTGKVSLDFTAGAEIADKTAQIRLMLLDKGTTKGFVIKKASAGTTSFQYTPSPDDNGNKTLAVGFYDEENNLIAGDAVSVKIDVDPLVEIAGIERMDLVNDSASFGVTANFPIYAVKYTITSLTSGRTKTVGRFDPLSKYTWTPTMEENGVCTIQATVYDKKGNTYTSQELQVIASVSRKLIMAGVSEGMTINKPVSLIASRNFDVNSTTYLLRDPERGNISVITTIPYGSYEWFPGPELAGEKELAVRVLDTKGVYHYSNYVKVTISDSPQFVFKGLGPNQVLTSGANLSLVSNVKADTIKYKLTDLDSGSSRYINGSVSSSGAATFTPAGTDDGLMRIQAEATYNGQTYTTASVDFKVYLGKIYGPEPIIEQAEFLGFVSEMAIESKESTGMSAALQTAQAILETGWGQSVPVDKYTGLFSNNLFGIKGTGTNGSVISNTWEVYNGVSFRTDASFRAYLNVDEAWADHKVFLLTLSRYESFRTAMHDCAEGAWALKRAGYATDPLYAIKLLDLINKYDLWALDLEGF